MAKNLLKQGHTVVVHNRSREAVAELVAAGAVDGDSPGGVAEQSDIIITMVPDAPDVRDVLQGNGGVFEKLRAGQIIIDMSTISPTVAKELADEAAQRGVMMLDAPVSGGEIGAVQGTLSIMIGGTSRRSRKCARSWRRWATRSASSASANPGRARFARRATGSGDRRGVDRGGRGVRPGQEGGRGFHEGARSADGRLRGRPGCWKSTASE